MGRPKNSSPALWQSKIVGHGKVAPDQLVANPLNFRVHPQAQRDALEAAIAEVGFIRSVTVNKRTGNLVDGHERVWQALKTEQPTIDVEYVDLSEDEEKKALATLDPISELAHIDKGQLDLLLRDVNTGSEALQQMFADMTEKAGLYTGEGPTAEIVEDEAPEPPKDPVTRPGNLWLLGEHRLLCGDSTQAEHVRRVMGGERAGLCFTSPPYGQQRDYTAEGKAKVQDWDGLMRGVFENLPMADDGQVLVNLGLIHRDGEWMPYWDGWIEWMRERGWRRFGWYVWDQGWGLPGDWNGRLAPSHEFVFHFNRESSRPAKCVKSKVGGQTTKGKRGLRAKDGTIGRLSHATGPESEYTYPTEKIPDSVIRVHRQCGGVGHPAPFSVAFVAFGLECWTGLLYEPFAGSGTTLIAAEQLNRRCFGIEISPAYCDVIVARWEKFTGKKAQLAQG